MSISLQSILLLLLLLNLHEYLFFILFVLGKNGFLQNYHFSLIICAHVCVIFFILFSDILYFRVELISHMWSLDMKHISMKLALECCLFYNMAFFNLHVFFSQLCCKFLQVRGSVLIAYFATAASMYSAYNMFLTIVA